MHAQLVHSGAGLSPAGLAMAHPPMVQPTTPTLPTAHAWARVAEVGLPVAAALDLEASECAAYRSLFEAGAALFGAAAFQVIDSGDGATAFLSPLVQKAGIFNRVLGMGIQAHLRTAVLAELSAQYGRAGCVPAFDFPHAPQDSGAVQAARALHLRRVDRAVILARELSGEAPQVHAGRQSAAGGVRIAAVRGEQCGTVASICAEVFGVSDTVRHVLRALQDQPGWQHWLALLGDRPVGAALSFTHGARCWFGWAATLPQFRGCGVKGALDDARIGGALDAGCTLVCTDTALGTPEALDHSLRSLMRRGFTPRYLRDTYLLMQASASRCALAK